MSDLWWSLVVLAAVAVTGCGEGGGPSSVVTTSPARGLSPLRAPELWLLPGAIVAPSPREVPPVPAFDRRFVSKLAGARSWSIGTTNKGYLVGGQALTASASLALRPVSVRRDAIYGTEALVGALERAAARVARRWPKSVLWAGDLSARAGGDLPHHRSHNSGRDVDLGFYLVDAAGGPADRARFAEVGADLRTRDGLVFDRARSWALIAALLSDPSAQVQWVFIARHLSEALIKYAERVGADRILISRARRVLRQPGDSTPHADHIHLRIYCSRDERLEGCLDAPPFHPWVRRYEAELKRLVAGMLPFLDLGWGEELRFAITRLVRMNAREALPRLRALSEDPDPRVAELAAAAVAFLEGRGGSRAWDRWRIEPGLYD